MTSRAYCCQKLSWHWVSLMGAGALAAPQSCLRPGGYLQVLLCGSYCYTAPQQGTVEGICGLQKYEAGSSSRSLANVPVAWELCTLNCLSIADIARAWPLLGNFSVMIRNPVPRVPRLSPAVWPRDAPFNCLIVFYYLKCDSSAINLLSLTLFLF